MQMVNTLKESDVKLLGGYASFVTAAAFMHRITPIINNYLPSASDTDISNQISALTRLKEAAKTSLTLASSDMDMAANLVCHYSGNTIEIKSLPTQAFYNDIYLHENIDQHLNNNNNSNNNSNNNDNSNSTPILKPIICKAIDDRTKKIVTFTVRSAVSTVQKRLYSVEEAVNKFTGHMEVCRVLLIV